MSIVAAPGVAVAVLRTAQARLPAHRSGIQMSFHESRVPTVEFSALFALVPYYEMHKMENCQLSAHSSPVPVFVSRLEDEAALYGLLIESFAENLDVNIPSCDDWMAGRLESRQF